MTTQRTTKPATDLFDQAMKNYEEALKAGLKLHEESCKLWAGVFNQAATPQDLQQKVRILSEDLVPQLQKGMEDCLKLIEQNNRNSAELLKQAMTAAQSASVQEAQSKFQGFFESSLNTLRDSAEAITQTNTKAFHSWFELGRKWSQAAGTAGTKG